MFTLDYSAKPHAGFAAPAQARPVKKSSRHRLLVLCIYVALIGMGLWIGSQWDHITELQSIGMDPAMMWQIMAVGLLVFMLTSAMPFVPGAEIGLGLLVIFGSKVAVFVYAAMVSALTLAYLMGVLVPPVWLARFFGYVGFRRAKALVEELAQRERRERVAYLLETAPPKWVPHLLKHRYLAMMVVLNLPGNSLVGGGGGLALAAGMSGLFRFPHFVAMLLVAVAPVPLFFYITM